MGYWGQPLSGAVRNFTVSAFSIDVTGRLRPAAFGPNALTDSPKPEGNRRAPAAPILPVSGLIKLSDFLMAAVARGFRVAINVATVSGRPTFIPGIAKPGYGSSTRLSGERWWTHGEEQESLRYKAEEVLQKLSDHRFTRSCTGLYVHFWGYL